MNEYQQFLSFCFKNGYIKKQQLENICKLTEKSNHNFFDALTQVTGYSKEEVEHLKYLYSNSQSTTRFQRTNTNRVETQPSIPPKIKESFIFAQEVYGLGLVPLKQLNTCMFECCKEGEERNILQYMLAKRLISTKDFLSVQKSASPDKWQTTSSALEIRNNGTLFYLEKKSTLKKIAHYNIIREIGRGGMGIVYEAEDPNLKRTIAIKTMISEHAGEINQERFVREAQLVASLKHPGIVQVYEIGQENNVTFFVMDYVDGVSLVEYMQMMKLDITQKIKLFIKVVEALLYAHEQKIIHRDIKPDNIIVDPQGNPYLMDFGLAKQTKNKDSLTITGDAIGTPMYMSPEQVEGRKGQIRHSTDIYSLGAVLYQVLTGKPPFVASNVQTLFLAIISKEPIPPRKLVDDLHFDIETICLKCLEKNPENRYKDMSALLLDLQNFLNGENIQARPQNIVVKTQKIIRRHQALCASIAIILLALFTFIYFFFLVPGNIQLVITGKINGEVQQVSPVVFIDGQKVGEKKSYVVSNGYHNVKIEYPAFETLEMVLQVKSGKEIKIEKELNRITGKITIQASTPGIQVFCKNLNSPEKIELFAPIYEYTIPVGNYEVSFTKENYFSQQKLIKVLKNEIVDISIAMESMQVWEYKFDSITEKIAVTDIDMDGKSEIYATLRTGQIVSYDIMTRQTLWKYNQKSGTRDFYPLKFRDVNKDGYDDIVYANADDFYILDGLNRQILFRVDSWWGGHYVFIDVNGDGYEEIILFNRFHGIRCYDYTTNQILWSIPTERGKHFDIKPVFIDKGILLCRTSDNIYIINCFLAKISLLYENKPSFQSFFFSESHQKLFIVATNGIYCHNPRDFTEQWFVPINTKVFMSDFVITDIDGDNKDEIYIHGEKLHCIDLHGNVKWEFDCNTKRKALAPIITDCDKDGNLEIIVGSDNKVYILDNKGNLRSHFTLSNNLDSIFIADTDGDGFLEIICHSGQYIYAMKPFLSSFKKEYSDQITGQNIHFIDVNNDDVQDLLMFEGHEMYVLDGLTFQKIWQQNLQEDILCIYIGQNNKITCATHNSIYILQNKEILENYPHNIVDIYAASMNDLDNDNHVEIFFTINRTDVICFSTKKKVTAWSANIDVRHGEYRFLDCNDDGVKDVIGLAEAKDELGFSRVHCLSGINGKYLWQNITLRPGDILVGCAIAYFDQKPLLFVCQIAGAVSHIDFRTGEIIWHKQLATGAIIDRVCVEDFNKDNKLEAIIISEDGDVYALSLTDGSVLWHHYIKDSNSNRLSTPFVTKINGKNILVMTYSPFEFYAIDSKDGSWYANSNLQVFQKRPSINLLNNDDQLDFIGISEEYKIVQIFSLEEYIKKSFAPNILIHPNQKNSNIFKFHQIHKNKAYASIFDYTINTNENIVDFYYALGYISQKKYDEALVAIKAYLKKCPHSFKAKFALFLILLNTHHQEAKELMLNLMNISLYDFDSCLLEYKKLLSSEGSIYLEALLPEAIIKNKYFETLPSLYSNTILMKNENEKLLDLSLKYTIPKKDVTYNERRKKYIQKIIYKLGRTATVYLRARAYAILEEAHHVLPNEPIFIMEKAKLELERRNYQEAQKLFAIMVDKKINDISAQVGNIICLLLMNEYQQAKEELVKNQQIFTTYKGMHQVLKSLILRQNAEVVKEWNNLMLDKEMKELFESWGYYVQFSMILSQKR